MKANAKQRLSRRLQVMVLQRKLNSESRLVLRKQCTHYAHAQDELSSEGGVTLKHT